MFCFMLCHVLFLVLMLWCFVFLFIVSCSCSGPLFHVLVLLFVSGSGKGEATLERSITGSFICVSLYCISLCQFGLSRLVCSVSRVSVFQCACASRSLYYLITQYQLLEQINTRLTHYQYQYQLHLIICII